MTISLEQRLKSDTLRRAWLEVLEHPSDEADDRLLEALDAALAISPGVTTEQVIEDFEEGLNDTNPARAATYHLTLNAFLQGQLDVAGGHRSEGFIWTASETTREEVDQKGD